MPFRICRWSSFGRPVQGFSGGSSGSSCCHCWSVKSPRLMALKWEFRPEKSAVCRHGLAGGDLTRTQDWRQLAFEEINESVLIRPDLDQNEVVKASLDRAIDGREMRLW